ncbi:MAG: hypothetical protein ACD_62C00034G0002 [uncultured bacterium]|nr:MAG: hypothetical protein ACD_62C00034G0002 [uncultured bacterium]
MGQKLGDERMTSFMISNNFLFFIADQHATPLNAHENLVFGHFEIVSGHRFLIQSGRVQGRLVHEIFEIGPAETGSPSRDGQEIDVFVQRHFAGMNLEDRFAPQQIGSRHHNAAIETTWPEQSGIQHVGPVGGRNDDHPFVGFKTIHLDQQLIEGLLALIVTTTQTGTAVTTDSVDLIHKNDTGGIFFALFKEVSHARSPHPHKHLNKIGARDGIKRNTGLTRNRPGQ